MAEFNQEENKVEGVFGGVNFGDENQAEGINVQEQAQDIQKGNENVFVKINTDNLPTKQSIWSKVRAVLFKEIKVELTPYQQKVENEINEFLHQEITFKGFFNLFKSK